MERKARVGEAGSVASGVGERSGTRFGLKRGRRGRGSGAPEPSRVSPSEDSGGVIKA